MYMGYKKTQMTYYPVEAPGNVPLVKPMKFNYGDRVKLVFVKHPTGPRFGAEGIVFQRVGAENSPNCVNVQWDNFNDGWRRNIMDFLANCWAVDEDQLALVKTQVEEEHPIPFEEANPGVMTTQDGTKIGLESGGSHSQPESQPSDSSSTKLEVGSKVKVVKTSDDMVGHQDQQGVVTYVDRTSEYPYEVMFSSGDKIPFSAEELELIQPEPPLAA
jgi:hypothetical protein